MGISRRRLLQATFALGAGLAAPGRTAIAGTPAPAGPRLAAPLGCDLSGWTAPRTSANLRPPPFTVPLPRPEIRRPVGGQPTTLHVAAADVELLPGVATRMLTYDGSFPGPTILASPGQEVLLDVVNGLDEDAVLHLHGAHVAAAHDGHVRDVISTGATRRYRYANVQRPSALWYHDHVRMRTAERVYRGLAGGYLLLDRGEAALGLPVGDERDVFVVLTDKSFADDGSLLYTGGDHTPMVGDVVLANGADRPRLEVAAGLVRLRVLNGSNARPFVLQRTDGAALVQIGTDGGLLGAPSPRPSLEIWPSERVELLLDLSGAAVGEQVTIADALDAEGIGILRVDVVEGPAGPATAPTALPALEDLGPPEVTRTIVLGQDADGRFLLAGHGWDDAVRDVYARLGAVERWRLVNATRASHPMHLHLVSFRVTGRLDSRGMPMPLRPEDEGWKDTVVVKALETVEVDARFDDHLGDFMYHCHVLEHEDHDMMSQFRVVDAARVAGRNRVETAAAVLAGLGAAPGVLAVAGGADWHAALPAAALADGLVLVAGGSLDPAVVAELQRRPPRRIVVAGTPDVVPESILVELSAHAPTTRVAGADAPSTAALVAADLVGTAPLAVVATQAVFADALAAGTLGVPILLTDRDALPPATTAALDALGVVEVLVAGGPAAVSDSVVAALSVDGRTVTRVAGADRTATAAAFARLAGISPLVWAASADRFPDALGAAVAVREEGMLVLVGDGGASEATAALMAEAGAARLRVVGGEASVSLDAEASLAALLDVAGGTTDDAGR